MRHDRLAKVSLSLGLGLALALALPLSGMPIATADTGALPAEAGGVGEVTATEAAPTHTAKPGARVALAIQVLERAAPGESFRLVARVTPLVESDVVVLNWRGGPGVSLEGETAITLVAPPAGTPLEFELRGRWSGELPGRVYLAAEWQGAGRRVPQAVAASIIDAASEARLRRPAPRDGVRAHEVEP